MHKPVNEHSSIQIHKALATLSIVLDFIFMTHTQPVSGILNNVNVNKNDEVMCYYY